jgi:Txe/YoeB family toxin of toxin-antitoxin system
MRQAQKDILNIKRAGLQENVIDIIAILSHNPFQNPPPYKKLLGDMSGAYSRRINKQHRLVYSVSGNIVRILRMWTHYE